MRAALAVAVLLAACTAPEPFTALTLNLANGAGDAWRTPGLRARQRAWLADAGAQVVALQEVDRFVARSGGTDTARDALGLECTVRAPEFSVDGVAWCEGTQGVLVFGVGFCGADPYGPGGTVPGVMDGDSSLNPVGTDVSPGACFGNAAFVGAGALKVSEAFAVGLPVVADAGPEDSFYASLGKGRLSDGLRAELGARNLALRAGPAIEPRAALVTRVQRVGAPDLSLVVVHLESEGGDALRLAQLGRVMTVVRAERVGPPARQVVLLGDFNMGLEVDGAAVAAGGLASVVGAVDGGIAEVDQLWVDAALKVVQAERVATQGASDHPFAVRATAR